MTEGVSRLECSATMPGESHGICDGFGTCQCSPPFIGDDCSTKVRVYACPFMVRSFLFVRLLVLFVCSFVPLFVFCLFLRSSCWFVVFFGKLIKRGYNPVFFSRTVGGGVGGG